jgi:hypothetical protein
VLAFALSDLISVTSPSDKRLHRSLSQTASLASPNNAVDCFSHATSNMQNQLPSRAAPSQSANDNGPLSSGQVKALKITIAVMSFLIVAALLAIVGRVIYLASVKKTTSTKSSVVATEIAPAQTMRLPPGAVVKSMSLNNNRLLVHYQTTTGPGAAILDLTTGKTLSQVQIKTREAK